MKEMIITAMIFLLLPVAVSALHGGDTLSFNFADCQNLLVNITYAQLNEWTATPNCTEQTAGNFYCTCSGNWTLNLTPAINSEGTFGISITNIGTIQTTTQTIIVSSGGGGVVFVPTTSTTTVTVSPPSGGTGNTATTTTTPQTQGQTPTATSTSILPATAAAITGFFSIPTVQYGTFGIFGLIIMLLLAWFILKSRRQSLNNNEKNETPAGENSSNDADQTQTQTQTQNENQDSSEINQ